MKRLIRCLFIVVALSSGLAASATEPEPMDSKPKVATAAEPGASAAPDAPSVQSAKSADVSASTATDGKEPAAARVPTGYKAKKIDGETVYCRKTTPLGTRFPTDVCMTVAQYEESVRQRDGLRQELTGKQKSYSISR